MNTAFFKNLLSLISSCVLLCFGFRETTESGDSDAFLKNDHGSQAETTGGSHAATAGGSLAATAGRSHSATANESHSETADEFPHMVKVYMTQTGGDIWNFSKQGGTIDAILRDVLDPSQYIVRYGRNYSFCIICLRTKQDADSVVKELHNKKVELPKKVNLSAEHVDEKIKQKVPKDKAASAPAPAPAPAAPGKRCVLVRVQSDAGVNMEIRPHEVPFLLWVFGTYPTSETPEEVSLKRVDTPTYMPYQADLKICHHVSRRDFLWLKFESEEKAQFAINKMNGQEFIRDEHDKSTYRVVVEFTDSKF